MLGPVRLWWVSALPFLSNKQLLVNRISVIFLFNNLLSTSLNYRVQMKRIQIYLKQRPQHPPQIYQPQNQLHQTKQPTLCHLIHRCPVPKMLLINSHDGTVRPGKNQGPQPPSLQVHHPHQQHRKGVGFQVFWKVPSGGSVHLRVQDRHGMPTDFQRFMGINRLIMVLGPV